MVVIDEIRSVRSAVCIRLDNGSSFWLRNDDLVGAPFSVGAEWEESAFRQAVLLRQYPRALNLAVAMLACRPCSRGEILSRLKARRFTDETAELVVCKLEKEKLLNDEEFCEQWIRFRIARGYGPAVIRRELKMKGISPDLMESVFSRIDFSDEEDHALTLARKAWARAKEGEDIRKTRQRVVSSLVRKGFSWEDAGRACSLAEKEFRT